jgi:hypothetical protein
MQYYTVAVYESAASSVDCATSQRSVTLGVSYSRIMHLYISFPHTFSVLTTLSLATAAKAKNASADHATDKPLQLLTIEAREQHELTVSPR